MLIMRNACQKLLVHFKTKQWGHVRKGVQHEGLKNLTESIYKFGLSVWVFVCLFVCLYPINVKTAEPIGPKFFVGHLGTPGKVYE